MTVASTELEVRFARFVEHHVIQGEQLPLDRLCSDRPDLAAPLRALIQRYLALTASFDDEGEPGAAGTSASAPGRPGLPAFDGFETIERIGAGGMGEVYKLRDLRLHRIVAAKVVRTDLQPAWQRHVDRFLHEARALALFKDRRIVQIHECRLGGDRPVIIMEFVEGFELGRLGPSLEFAQRARILIEICEAVHHAHTLGLQHRDLKPSNIMLDARLVPRILDFGLSASDPTRGHFVGTVPYVAPEQLDPARTIDARTDVYALGVILYELLCGRPPFEGDEGSIISRIRGGVPPLPIEIAPDVPEPLQAIALAAMEREPSKRYASALDMAADLRRFLAGHAVLARPSLYDTTLGARVRPHLEELKEWLRLRLIYPHEAERLRAAYGALDAREDDWIVASRSLSFPQIALYLGAFLLLCGSLFYFVAARWYGNVHGVLPPFIALALPFIGLNAGAHVLYRRDHKAVAVAFYLAAIALLPLFLLILFHETRLFVAGPSAGAQLFENGAVSNRQLQITTAVACAWCGWLALGTRTAALSTVFTGLALLVAVSVAGDFGLRTAVETGRWDRVALLLSPLVAAYGTLGLAAERSGRPWFSRPLYLGSAAALVVVLELLALDGRALRSLGGLSLAPWQSPGVSDPELLDTIVAMTINGGLFYGAGALLTRRGSETARAAAHFLFTISPFALLHPLGYLVRTGEYSPRIDWLYAAAATVVILASERRQRPSFYYAGLLNLGIALVLVASHRQWFERPGWALAVIAAGLASLLVGFALDRIERRRGRKR